MNLHGITVCVNYSDLLARSLDRWHTGLDRLIVVTSPQDKVTQDLCRFHNVQTHITDIFYANGASFNKFAALSEAVVRFDLLKRVGWQLVFDADIVPPADWRERANKADLKKGNLYGAYRYWQPENANPLLVEPHRRMPQSWVLGFFCLFHTRDPRLPQGPLFDPGFPHAGVSDTLFARRWPYDLHWLLDIPLVHLGEERTNWLGRGHDDEMRELLKGRKTHEGWEHERMVHPPEIK